MVLVMLVVAILVVVVVRCNNCYTTTSSRVVRGRCLVLRVVRSSVDDVVVEVRV